MSELPVVLAHNGGNHAGGGGGGGRAIGNCWALDITHAQDFAGCGLLPQVEVGAGGLAIRSSLRTFNLLVAGVQSLFNGASTITALSGVVLRGVDTTMAAGSNGWSGGSGAVEGKCHRRATVTGGAVLLLAATTPMSATMGGGQATVSLSVERAG